MKYWKCAYFKALLMVDWFCRKWATIGDTVGNVEQNEDSLLSDIQLLKKGNIKLVKALLTKKA